MSLNLDHNKKYLLGCSFGPDSMALFHMLKEEKYQFAVAHVNYGLRKEADKETEALVNYCQKNNIVIYTNKIQQIPLHNIEAECRQIRYRFFADLCQQNHFDFVLVGHHQDDLLETFLLQKRRKSLVNYYGLKRENHIFGIDVVRPLLAYRKSDLLLYCQKNNVPFAIDSSNLTDCYERNKIRHHVIENLNDANRQKLLRDIDEANDVLLEMQKELHNHDIHSCSYLLTLNQQFLAHALHISSRELQEETHLSLPCINEIRNVLLSEKPNISMKVNSNLLFIKSYDQCNFILRHPDITYSYVLRHPDLLDNEYFYLDFRQTSLNRNVNGDDYPLTIRNAKSGDTTMIRNYRVLIRRLFIDWKMPIELRKRWPVILNKDGIIVYVPRYQKDFMRTKNINFYVK